MTFFELPIGTTFEHKSGAICVKTGLESYNPIHTKYGPVRSVKDYRTRIEPGYRYPITLEKDKDGRYIRIPKVVALIN